MDSVSIKQEPKCEEDFEDFFCEEETKVCLLSYIKILWYQCVEVIIVTCFVYHGQFHPIILEIAPPDFM